MKRMFALILVLCSLCVAVGANAAQVTAAEFDALIPDYFGLDITAFEGHEILFNNFTFSGSISTGIRINLKSTEVYINLDYSAERSLLYFEPKWESAAMNGHLMDFYVLIGQNRYKVNKTDLYEVPLGITGFYMLKEMGEYEGPVMVMCRYDNDEYTLTDADKLAIRSFVEKCERSGIVKYIPEDGAVSVITAYN